ncbi:MAG: hypothetical protein LBD16_04005 [Oscillospiraceae bacterium]|nr:hypothetical protein [Oscillospiraceae bacterium]
MILRTTAIVLAMLISAAGIFAPINYAGDYDTNAADYLIIGGSDGPTSMVTVAEETYTEYDEEILDYLLYSIDSDGFPKLVSVMAETVVSGFIKNEPFYVNYGYLFYQDFFESMTAIRLTDDDVADGIVVYFAGGIKEITVYNGAVNWDEELEITRGNIMYRGPLSRYQYLVLPNIVPELFGDTLIVSFNDSEFGARSYYLAWSGRTGDIVLIPYAE